MARRLKDRTSTKTRAYVSTYKLNDAKVPSTYMFFYEDDGRRHTVRLLREDAISLAKAILAQTERHPDSY